MIGNIQAAGGIPAYSISRAEGIIDPARSSQAVNAGGANPTAETNASGVRQKNVLGAEECQTCKNRRYQDGSNDPGVSFKAPTKLSPDEAASAVFAHEREHVTREATKANDEGREVVSSDIRIFTAVCPECGKVYVSGGETRTVTKAKQENVPFAVDFFQRTLGPYNTGRNMDVKA
jgi:hypothetical protein